MLPDANPGRRGGMPKANRLSYGTAKKQHLHLNYYRQSLN
jgi:hypothetical protein